MNRQVAARLAQAADLLEQQGANPFRVTAYRRASVTVARLDRDLRELLDAEGPEGLLRLPNVGRGIAGAIQEILITGDWAQLQRWRGALDPVQVLQTVPGIGAKTAERIHETLHIDSLEALEAAAYDGRLASVPGLGARRVAGIRDSLATLLARTHRHPRLSANAEPPVGLVLRVDELYRAQAEEGRLPVIAPRRHNPEGRAWLPVLHTQRGDWHFTAMFSNTARAHELGRTHDWVVIYFYDDHHAEGQCTVVTETRGPLAGRRVIRGRELECRQHYAEQGLEEASEAG